MYGTSSSSSRKRTYPHVSLIIVIQYSPLQSGHAPRWDTWRRPPLHHRLLLTRAPRAEDRNTNKTESPTPEVGATRRDATRSPATGLTATGGGGERTPFSTTSSLSFSLSPSFSPSRPPAALHTTPETRLDHHDNDVDDDDELLGAPLRSAVK